MHNTFISMILLFYKTFINNHYCFVRIAIGFNLACLIINQYTLKCVLPLYNTTKDWLI